MAAHEASSHRAPRAGSRGRSGGESRSQTRPGEAPEADPEATPDDFVDLQATDPAEVLEPDIEPYPELSQSDLEEQGGDIDLGEAWDQTGAPDEFTFGWNDLEVDDDASAPVDGVEPMRSSQSPPQRRKRPAPRGPKPSSREDAYAPAAGAKPRARRQKAGQPSRLGHELARLAAATHSPIQSAGLIAAAAPLILEERLGEPPDGRILATTVAAAATLAHQLHQRPRDRAHLARFPEIIGRLADALRRREAQAGPVTPQLIRQWLARYVRQTLAQDYQPPRREHTLGRDRPAHAASDRLEHYLAEWWADDEPRA